MQELEKYIKNRNDIFKKLLYDFLAGKYDIEAYIEGIEDPELDNKLDDCADASIELHNHLPTIEDLIPLLTSQSETCNITALFIAAQETTKLYPIFDYIFDHLTSPYVDNRKEACRCFGISTTKPEHFIALFECLDDPEERVRDSAITAMMEINNHQACKIFDYVKDNVALSEIKRGVSLFAGDHKNMVNFDVLKEVMLTESRKVKLFAYGLAVCKFANRPCYKEHLAELVSLSSEPHIVEHYEINNVRHD
ncbi:hypothetical protein H4J57_09865 [Colwellia sp. BRX8-7]|uniref:hypothetical protein n=1 Tax=Colwellia sp. BRX8-7 TaxID=2759833 RepID=UPI0015F388C3|nr:hypothetical protein [Colwellia sp. BRX8-7]MBA6337506.1 hypothetical protein [Colwellia sp. BRX8-7]